LFKSLPQNATVNLTINYRGAFERSHINMLSAAPTEGGFAWSSPPRRPRSSPSHRPRHRQRRSCRRRRPANIARRVSTTTTTTEYDPRAPTTAPRRPSLLMSSLPYTDESLRFRPRALKSGGTLQ
jgi:hypothetical protein